MPVTTLVPPGSDELLRRKRFSRSEVQRMTDAGIFAGQRFELIEGDLIDKMGQNPPHAMAIRRLDTMLRRVFREGQVQVRLPIEAAKRDQEHSLPEPDIAVLAESEEEEYDERHPSGSELLLIVEVADTSLRQDSVVKRDLYARAGVPEYWVLDLAGRQLLVHRSPVSGRYTFVTNLDENSQASIESRPGAAIPVSAILPRAPK